MTGLWYVIFALPFVGASSGSLFSQYNVIFSAFGNQNKTMRLQGTRGVPINCLVVPKSFHGGCEVPRMTDAVQLPFMQRVLLHYISIEIQARLRVIGSSSSLKEIMKLGAEVRDMERDVFNWFCHRQCGAKPSCHFLTLVRPQAESSVVLVEMRVPRHNLSVFFPNNNFLRYILGTAKNPEGWLRVDCKKL